ncbi:OmpA family protein [Hymenobacter sp. HSC-4F20]|uniref:OmpA family protein n=1 Tax=Hymenobacter sp. HSC-4F20 TaxID=2864135 RepID=UPI001C72E014|nr:OmpA family protein [Hymenobacter sp. HSC-4F20]MBX0292430.1 OmpA family protein [Hymenobacter sp. HSC-4F20]
MEQTVTHTAQVFFTHEVVGRLAEQTHESQTGIWGALSQLVPLVVHSLAGRASGPDGPEAIWKLSREAYGASVLETIVEPGQENWLQRGEALMRGLLGEAYHFTSLQVAAAAGISSPTVTHLLSVTAVAALGVAGEYSQEHTFDAGALARWFQQDEEGICRLLLAGNAPAERPSTPVPQVTLGSGSSGLATTSSGNGAWATVGGGRTYTPPPPAATPATPIASQPWAWGVLLLTAVGLGYFFGHDSGDGKESAGSGLVATSNAAMTPATPTAATSAAAATAGHYDPVNDTYIYDTGQPLILRLADGTTQKVGATSTENRLYTFLADPTMQVDSVNRTKGWINFDRVYFETGQSTLTDESFQQLRNVASILKTFPRSVVKIGGYTDSTGNAVKNFQISEDRAKTAMLVLASLGVDMNRLQAKGYGGKYFVTSNITPEGRALNRRISIRVIKK